ncbi:histidine ammonia-lyase [Bartonella sp. JB63]|nr:histidine ammonia-lyase [Bartonella sp. JB15]AQX29376.1 histidine ammonia-lyase [Bartonella sp. JB63]
MSDFTIIGIETLIAAQGIEYRAPFKTSPFYNLL